jgi:N6-adenosine-specific RNA methylase IME4
MADQQLVLIRDIVIPPDRMRQANHIADLGESIRQNGLLHPITLRRDGDRLVLIAGLRRLQAMQYLRHGEIAAYILEVDEVQALLIEIDENLQRAELTELQRAQHVTERKRIWEGLYPQTRHGATPGAKGTGRGKRKREAIKVDILSTLIPEVDRGMPAIPVMSFVDETAMRSQRTARTVRRSVKIGTKITRKAQVLLAGTPVEDKQTELMRVANIADESTQVAVATLLHEGKASTVVRAQRMLEAEKLREAPPPLPTGPFDVVVVDPPWQFYKRPQDATKRENITYATMTLDEMCALPVASLAAEHALLWLWTTNAHLPDAFAIVAAWGFVYKTLLTWDKVRLGMGDWLRGQTEHCLLCVRGKASVLLTNETTLLREASTRHSQKPEAFYVLVEQLCPGAKVELFGRRRREGWTIWGNVDPLEDSTVETELTLPLAFDDEQQEVGTLTRMP